MNTQKKQIIILLILLIIISIANYNNYYVSKLPDDKITDLSSFSEKQKMDFIKNANKIIKNGLDNIKVAKNNISDKKENIVDENEKNTNAQTVEVSKFDNKTNYIENAVNINGKLSVWNKKNISVYIQPDTNYNKVVKEAFNLYNKIYKDYFELYPVSSVSEADIKVYFVKTFSKGDIKDTNMGGLTSVYTDNNGDINSAVIKLLTENPNTHKMNSSKVIYSVILHEIGHALGIVGHSSNNADIMYPFITNFKPVITERDRNTLKLMYSKQSKNVNENVERFSEVKLNEAKKYSEINSKETLSWINLAKTYYRNGNKEQAMEAFQKAISIDSKNPDIYIAMGDCYYSSQKYKSAISNYSKAYDLSVDTLQKVEIQELRGVTYIKMNNFEKAYEDFLEVYKVRKEDKKILYNLVVSCVNTNRKKETIFYIDEYRKLGIENSKLPMINEAYDWASR